MTVGLPQAGATTADPSEGADRTHGRAQLLRRPFVLLLLLMLPAALTLLAPGYFLTAHDGRHSIWFLVEFEQTLREGVPWPVWGTDFAVGFGYPFFLIYAPLAYYVAEIFRVLGFGMVEAVKATWAVGLVLGAAGVYLLCRRWWGKGAALGAALAFTYAPYRLVQMYVRAALSEYLALALLPWVILALDRLLDRPGPRRAALVALALAAVLLTHTVSALMFVPVLGAFALFRLLQSRRPWRHWLWAGAGAGIGGLLSAIFWLPMMLERRYVDQVQWTSATYDYQRHFVYPSQLLDPGWGYGFSVPGTGDGMSFQLGLPLLVLAVFGMWSAARSSPHNAGRRSGARFWSVVTLIAVLAMLPIAAPVWSVMPLVGLVQFPWRFLALAVFALALLAGGGLAWLDQAERPGGAPAPSLPVFLLIIVIASLPYTSPPLVAVTPVAMTPRAVIDFELEYPTMRGRTQWTERVPQNEDSPLIAQYLAAEPLRRAAISEGTGEILEQDARATSATARVRAESNVRLRFYTTYFPGWQATVDGQPAAIAPDGPNGLIVLTLPPGEHDVRLWFGPTPLRRGAAAASLAALALCAGLILWPILRRQRPA